jgi:hypothetical protein
MCGEDDAKPGCDLCIFCEGTMWYFESREPVEQEKTLGWDILGFSICVACGLMVIAAVARLF